VGLGVQDKCVWGGVRCTGQMCVGWG
jgi:hypothetical protein